MIFIAVLLTSSCELVVSRARGRTVVVDAFPADLPKWQGFASAFRKSSDLSEPLRSRRKPRRHRGSGTYRSVTRPLRSTSITPASSLPRGSPPLSGASGLSASRLEPLASFPLALPPRLSRSVPKPGRASRCLHSGCRSVSCAAPCGPAMLVRGRDGRYRPPPAQNRASGIPARGSHLGWVTANRCCGHGCRIFGCGR